MKMRSIVFGKSNIATKYELLYNSCDENMTEQVINQVIHASELSAENDDEAIKFIKIADDTYVLMHISAVCKAQNTDRIDRRGQIFAHAYVFDTDFADILLKDVRKVSDIKFCKAECDLQNIGNYESAAKNTINREADRDEEDREEEKADDILFDYVLTALFHGSQIIYPYSSEKNGKEVYEWLHCFYKCLPTVLRRTIGFNTNAKMPHETVHRAIRVVFIQEVAFEKIRESNFNGLLINHLVYRENIVPEYGDKEDRIFQAYKKLYYESPDTLERIAVETEGDIDAFQMQLLEEEAKGKVSAKEKRRKKNRNRNHNTLENVKEVFKIALKGALLAFGFYIEYQHFFLVRKGDVILIAFSSNTLMLVIAFLMGVLFKSLWTHIKKYITSDTP